jgi:MFS family permease
MADQEYLEERTPAEAAIPSPAAVPSRAGAPTGAGTAGRPGLLQAFGSLREPAFRQWFGSQVLSASGTMTQGVAQSWLVLKLTGSAVDLGLMASFTFLPLLVGGPWAGAIVDRFDTRRLLIVTQSLFIVLAGLLALLVATDSERLWMLFLIAIVTGTVAAPDSAGRQVYVFELVGTNRVASAVSLNEVVINTSRVLGPAVGGALLATVGVAACCFFNAATYLLPLAVLLAHRSLAADTPAVADVLAGRGVPTESSRARQRRAADPGGRLAGLQYAWHHPAIRVILLLAAASGMLFGLLPLPLLASRVFGLGGGGYGLMMAVFGIGALPGAVLAGAGRSSPSGRSVGALAIATGLAIVATAYAPDLGLMLTGLAVTGCISIWFIARANTLVQLAADPAMRGRVMGAWNMALPGCTPLTSPCVGWVSGEAGPRTGFALAGIALVCIAGSGWRALARGRRPAEAGRLD